MESKVYEGRGRDRTESCCMKECSRNIWPKWLSSISMDGSLRETKPKLGNGGKRLKHNE